MASYDKSYSTDYTTRVQNVLQGLGADLGKGGVDGKWGAYTDAAYNKYKTQVDAALAGGANPYGSASAMGGAYTVPNLSYKTRTLDELLAEANGLIGGAYDAQMLRQTQGYNTNQKALTRSYETARKTTQDSAVARGMGRSSYLTDAVANVGVKESDAVNQLTNDYNAAMAQLEANKSNAIYSYASQQQAKEQQLALEAALAQAELQYKYDALKAEQDMLEMKLAAEAKSSSSSGSSSSTKSKTKTDDYVEALRTVSTTPVTSNSFVADHLERSASNLASKGKVPEANSYVNQYNALTGANKPSYVDITDKDNMRDFLKKYKM